MSETERATYQDENPRPPRQTPQPIHILYRSRQQSRERTRERRRAEHHRKPELHLVSLVERRHVEDYTREESACSSFLFIVRVWSVLMMWV